MVEPEMIDETLKLARQGLAPTSVERQRLRAAIAARAALPVAPAAAAEGVLRGWPALKASGSSGFAVGATLLALGFAGGLWLGRGREPLLPPLPVPMTAPASEATPATNASVDVPVHDSAPVVERAPEPAAPKPASPAPRAHPAARRSDAFEHELALLQRAERAIRNQDPALALSLLGELEREHPRAALAEERKAARVMANCQAKEPTAPLAAERFLREAPGSVYSDRVRALCGLAGEQRTPSH
jgi:hypothetical protein